MRIGEGKGEGKMLVNNVCITVPAQLHGECFFFKADLFFLKSFFISLFFSSLISSNLPTNCMETRTEHLHKLLAGQEDKLLTHKDIITS